VGAGPPPPTRIGLNGGGSRRALRHCTAEVRGTLLAGPNSVISHDSALALYDQSAALPTEVHVNVPRSASRRRSGMRQAGQIAPQQKTNMGTREASKRRGCLPSQGFGGTIDAMERAL